MLTSQNAVRHNLSSPEGRRATVEEGTAFFIKMQKILQPDLALEIGAREASFSLTMRHLFPNIPVIAYEGSPKAYTFFANKNNYAGKGIRYINSVVADMDGTTKFNVLNQTDDPKGPAGTNGRNSLNDRDYDTRFTYSSLDVESVTGDTVLEKEGSRNATLWIDVEGASKQVLEGLHQSLTQKRIASIYIETESRKIWENQWLCFDVIDCLLSHGYLPIYKDDELNIQGNLIFIREESLRGDLFECLSHELIRRDKMSTRLEKLEAQITSLEENMINVCSLLTKFMQAK